MACSIAFVRSLTQALLLLLPSAVLLPCCAGPREDIKKAYAGDIVAIGGLKEVITGETLCDEKSPIILERMDFPDPVIKIAIEPKSKVCFLRFVYVCK